MSVTIWHDGWITVVHVGRLLAVTLVLILLLVLLGPTWLRMTPMQALILGVALSVVGNLLTDVLFHRNRTVFGQEFLGTLLGALAEGDAATVDAFAEAWREWRLGPRRMFALNERALLDDLDAIFALILSCREVSLEAEERRFLERALARWQGGLQNSLRGFGLDPLRLQAAIAVNLAFHARLENWSPSPAPLAPPDDAYLRALLELASVPLRHGATPPIPRLRELLDQLKEAISYVTVEARAERAVPIMAGFATLAAEAEHWDHAGIVRDHCYCQLINCVHFLAITTPEEAAASQALSATAEALSMASAEEVLEHLDTVQVWHPVLRALRMPARRTGGLDYQQLTAASPEVAAAYPDLVNLAILNTIATSVMNGGLDNFRRARQQLRACINTAAPGMQIYQDAIALIDSLRRHVEERRGSEEISILVDLARQTPDQEVKRCAVNNAIILCYRTADFSRAVALRVLLKSSSLQLSLPDHRLLTYAAQSRRLDFRLFRLPVWYPVQLMLNTLVPPLIRRASLPCLLFGESGEPGPLSPEGQLRGAVLRQS